MKWEASNWEFGLEMIIETSCGTKLVVCGIQLMRSVACV